jgi:SAM-dependent methyltransferase
MISAPARPKASTNSPRKFNNPANRDAWIAQQLSQLRAGSSLLDVGAGECPYKPLCGDLEYISQDVSQYDGAGNNRGCQTGSFSFDQIDIRCDLLDIPEHRQFDTVLCTEVLEHVADPIRSLEKLTRLAKPSGGKLLITTPFCSLTHFAPYYYSNGFSEYFYQHHLPRLGCRIDSIEFNGGWFDYLAQELSRTGNVHQQYFGKPMPRGYKLAVKFCRKLLQSLARKDRQHGQRSSELLTCGLHVVATRL